MCVCVHARLSNCITLFERLCVSVSGFVREIEKKQIFVFMCLLLDVGVWVPKKETGEKVVSYSTSKRGRRSPACADMSHRICHIWRDSTRSPWCPDPAAGWDCLALASQQEFLWDWGAADHWPSANSGVPLIPHILNSCLHHVIVCLSVFVQVCVTTAE